MFPKPANEAQRLDALRTYEILDSAPELAYDDIVELAAQICHCPIAYISFIGDDRRWLKARYGLRPEVVEAPRGAAVCATTICGTEVLTVPDISRDARFDQSPMAKSDPPCRFYCGTPLITDEGYALGTLCVMDFEPRKLDFDQVEALRRLSRQILTQLELRRHAHDLAAAHKAREALIDGRHLRCTVTFGRGFKRNIGRSGIHGSSDLV